jgi:phosphosulfolactate phosphohydrolase-like enzyme
VACRAFHDAQPNLPAAIADSRNGSRLLANAELRADVELCLRQDVYDFAAVLGADGGVRRIE